MATKNSKTYEEPAVAVLEEEPPLLTTKDGPREVEPFAVPQSSIAPRASDVGTHLRNPLMIGNPGEAGVAVLAKRVSISYTVGAFTGQVIKFPPLSQLLTIYVSIVTTFNGTTPALNFGRTAASAEFGTAALTGAAGTTVTVAVPAALIAPGWSLNMSLALTGATAGECLVTMVYSGAPLKTWQ